MQERDSKHTPGPWTWEKPCILVGGNNSVCLSSSNGPILRHEGSDWFPSLEDAALIASAPDMAAQLETQAEVIEALKLLRKEVAEAIGQVLGIRRTLEPVEDMDALNSIQEKLEAQRETAKEMRELLRRVGIRAHAGGDKVCRCCWEDGGHAKDCELAAALEATA